MRSKILVAIFVVSFVWLSAVSAATVPTLQNEQDNYFLTKSNYGANYLLYVPSTYNEAKTYPLILALGDSGLIKPLVDAGDNIIVVINKSNAPNADKIVNHIKSAYSTDEAKTYGIGFNDAAVDMLALNKKLPTLFASVLCVSNNASPVSDEYFPSRSIRFVNPGVSQMEWMAIVKETLSEKSGAVYNVAVRNPGAYSNAGEDFKKAVDGLKNTEWLAPKGSILGFDFSSKYIISRYKLSFVEPMPGEGVLQKSSDGKTWVDVDTFSYEKKVDRYVKPFMADKVRIVLNGSEVRVSEIEVYGEIPVSHKFKYALFKSKDNVVIPYRVFAPPNKKNIPLVVFLHGSGQRGADNVQHLGATKSEGATIWAEEANQKKNPCVVLVPQIPSNKVWRDKDIMNAMEELIEKVSETYAVDKNRIYGTGLSIGAEGLCNMSIQNGNIFAAMLLVAGGPNNPVGNAPPVEDTVVPNVEKIAHIPIWALQAFDDSVRPIGKTIAMIDGLRKLGVNPIFTIYLPGEVTKVATSSHSSWIYAYANPEVIKWMFAQNKNNPVSLGEKPFKVIGTLSKEELINAATGKNHVNMNELAGR